MEIKRGKELFVTEPILLPTDPSVRIAHSQLADFYAKRLATVEDAIAPDADPKSRRR